MSTNTPPATATAPDVGPTSPWLAGRRHVAVLCQPPAAVVVGVLVTMVCVTASLISLSSAPAQEPSPSPGPSPSHCDGTAAPAERAPQTGVAAHCRGR